MLKLLGNHVAITPIDDPDVTKGGIIIPDRLKGRCDQGIVAHVGPNCEWLKPGDYALFSGYSGKRVSIEGEGTFIIMSENFVVATISIDEIKTTAIPGLYLRDSDGFFPANYEMAIRFMAMAFKNSDIARFVNEKLVAKYEKEWEE